MQDASAAEVATRMKVIITAMAREALILQYPEAKRIFDASPESGNREARRTAPPPEIAKSIPAGEM